MTNYVERVYKVLNEVYQKKAFSQITLNQVLETSYSDDIPLITKIVYGVLDNDVYLDYFISQLVQKRPKPVIVIVLKIGIYMLKFINSVPAYAVVNNCVNLVKKIKKEALAGFVNATLKKAVEFQVTMPTDKIKKLSIETSYQEWYIKKLIKQYGETVAENILRCTPQGKTHIRINSALTTAAEFEKLLRNKKVEFSASEVVEGFYVSHSDLLKSKIDKSLYTNQGVSSIFACLALNVDSKTPCSVLDACSAPGGKSVYLAEHNPKSQVYAMEIYPHRIELIKAYASRMKIENIVTVCEDATIEKEELIEKFDYVLCDVPCSGFGVVNDKPDIKMFRQEKDIDTLSELQEKILRNVWKYVKKGGVLVYSTCTILQQENQNVISNVMKDNPNMIAQKIDLPFKGGTKIGEFIQLLPSLDEVQGFFIAKFKKGE